MKLIKNNKLLILNGVASMDFLKILLVHLLKLEFWDFQHTSRNKVGDIELSFKYKLSFKGKVQRATQVLINEYNKHSMLGRCSQKKEICLCLFFFFSQ